MLFNTHHEALSTPTPWIFTSPGTSQVTVALPLITLPPWLLIPEPKRSPAILMLAACKKRETSEPMRDGVVLPPVSSYLVEMINSELKPGDPVPPASAPMFRAPPTLNVRFPPESIIPPPRLLRKTST